MIAKQCNLLENPSDRRRRAHRKGSKRVHDGEPTSKIVTSSHPISLTASQSGAALLSPISAGICASSCFSGSKCFQPGSALNHDDSERGPLSTSRTLRFLR